MLSWKYDDHKWTAESEIGSGLDWEISVDERGVFLIKYVEEMDPYVMDGIHFDMLGEAQIACLQSEEKFRSEAHE